MSGVKHGSRLEQLYRLRQQINQEITVLERDSALDGGRWRPMPPPPPKPLARDQASLESLGVTAYQVKEWALEQGLVTEIRRGRVGAQLVEAFAAARDGIEVAG